MEYGTLTLTGGDVTALIYYDKSWLGDPTHDPKQAPLVDGPRGYCLDLINPYAKNAQVTVNKLATDGTTVLKSITVDIAQGDPVITGKGRSLTLAEMQKAGFSVVGDCRVKLLGPSMVTIVR